MDQVSDIKLTDCLVQRPQQIYASPAPEISKSGTACCLSNQGSRLEYSSETYDGSVQAYIQLMGQSTRLTPPPTALASARRSITFSAGKACDNVHKLCA